MAFLCEGSSISANLKSAWLALFRSQHTHFMRLPVEWTKVVTMDAPLNKYGLEIFFFFHLIEVQEWLKCFAGSYSSSAEHRATPKSSFRVNWFVAMMICGVWRVWGESIEKFWSGEQPGRWKRGESWREGYFVMRELLQSER